MLLRGVRGAVRLQKCQAAAAGHVPSEDRTHPRVVEQHRPRPLDDDDGNGHLGDDRLERALCAMGARAQAVALGCKGPILLDAPAPIELAAEQERAGREERKSDPVPHDDQQVCPPGGSFRGLVSHREQPALLVGERADLPADVVHQLLAAPAAHEILRTLTLPTPEELDRFRCEGQFLVHQRTQSTEARLLRRVICRQRLEFIQARHRGRDRALVGLEELLVPGNEVATLAGFDVPQLTERRFEVAQYVLRVIHPAGLFAEQRKGAKEDNGQERECRQREGVGADDRSIAHEARCARRMPLGAGA